MALNRYCPRAARSSPHDSDARRRESAQALGIEMASLRESGPSARPVRLQRRRWPLIPPVVARRKRGLTCVCHVGCGCRSMWRFSHEQRKGRARKVLVHGADGRRHCGSGWQLSSKMWQSALAMGHCGPVPTAAICRAPPCQKTGTAANISLDHRLATAGTPFEDDCGHFQNGQTSRPHSTAAVSMAGAQVWRSCSAHEDRLAHPASSRHQC